ncbi:CcmD family protein [Dyadobacter flavalbus]|uniref:CcmD family protein n=1 Tax=Dyadobacter flavalbus TaxID=2579942 RepID=A0A5M8QVK5_9BACT|nr:CcmD family protein [Dyadobacter flavalbus]KAA6438666.1 CcmD family protein [Dyadobacter flavalbus]
MKRVLQILFFLFFISGNTFAQAADNGVPMADKLREDGKIWVVVAVIAIVFLGIAVNMLRIDSRVSKIEKELNIK